VGDRRREEEARQSGNYKFPPKIETRRIAAVTKRRSPPMGTMVGMAAIVLARLWKLVWQVQLRMEKEILAAFFELVWRYPRRLTPNMSDKGSKQS
jgi:hypothetical protein